MIDFHRCLCFSGLYNFLLDFLCNVTRHAWQDHSLEWFQKFLICSAMVGSALGLEQEEDRNQGHPKVSFYKELVQFLIFLF